MVLRFDHHRPRSLDEARALAAALPEARILAGGTDLLVRMKGDRESPKDLVSLRSVAELSGVRPGEPLRIGAMTPLADLLENDELRYTTDFRSVYGTLISKWFGADATAVLGAEYPTLSFL